MYLHHQRRHQLPLLHNLRRCTLKNAGLSAISAPGILLPSNEEMGELKQVSIMTASL
jgi:hypothetical protein